MIEPLLRETLHDDRWDVAVRPGLLHDVRRGHARHRRRTAAATALAGAAVVAAAVGTVQFLPSGTDQLSPYASGGVPAGSPAPSISPAWTPHHGRDWLLTADEERVFYAAHTRPSPGPGQSTVSSPAPLGPQSEQLANEAAAADLPQGTKVAREDSVGGQPGAAALHIRLPNGSPVEVSRIQAAGPWTYETGHAGMDQEVTEVDIPGTTSAAVLYSAQRYGFGMAGTDHAIAVQVATRGGVMTTWVAPRDHVLLEELKRWAFAAARQAAEDAGS